MGILLNYGKETENIESVLEFNLIISNKHRYIEISIPPDNGKHSPYRLKLITDDHEMPYIMLDEYYSSNKKFNFVDKNGKPVNLNIGKEGKKILKTILDNNEEELRSVLTKQITRDEFISILKNKHKDLNIGKK